MTILMRARDTFWAPGDRLIRAGDMLAMDDPVVDGRENLFSPMSAPAASDPELLGRIARLEAALGQALATIEANSTAAAPAKAAAKKATS